MAEYDAELEELKRRKMLEYQRKLEAMQAEEEQKQLEEARRQEILRKILTPEARERLTNLRMVRPELVEQLEIQLIQLAQMGRVPVPVTDEILKEILMRLFQQQKQIKVKYSRGSLR